MASPDRPSLIDAFTGLDIGQEHIVDTMHKARHNFLGLCHSR